MAGYEKTAGFWPGPDMVSGATLIKTAFKMSIELDNEAI